MGKLKDETDELHSKAEQMPFNQRMINGELTKEEYGRYLKSMELIFSAIENEIATMHSSMYRTESIGHDIESLELSEEPRPAESAKGYAEYITTIDDISKLYGHVYLMYLAIVYGGNIIKQNVPGDGHYYEFENIGEIISEIRLNQRMYEETMIPEVKKGYRYMIKMFNELDES